MTRFLLLAALLAVPLASSAQAPFSPERLDAMFDSEPRIEVNLRGSLLRLAAEAARAEDPDAALMLDGLRAVTVRMYSVGDDRAGYVSRLTSLGRDFEADGWMTMVRVRSLPGDKENEGDIWVYVRDEGDMFGGLAVMAISSDEEDGDGAIFVHIDGTIDPADVARLSQKFGDVDISFGDNDDDDE